MSRLAIIVLAALTGCAGFASDDGSHASGAPAVLPGQAASAEARALVTIASLEADCARLRDAIASLPAAQNDPGKPPLPDMIGAPVPELASGGLDSPGPVVSAVLGPGPPHRASTEFRLLRYASDFQGAELGDGVDCPPEVRALRVVLLRPDAREVLVDLTRVATVAGQLYALCGLAVVDPALFGILVVSYGRHGGTVEFAPPGFYLQTRDVSEVVVDYVRDPEFRRGLVEGDAHVMALEFEEPFGLATYRRVMDRARSRVGVLVLRVIGEAPIDDYEAFEGLVSIAPTAPASTVPQILGLLAHEDLYVRTQGREVLAAVAPWTATRLDQLLEVLRTTESEAMTIELWDLLHDELIWKHAPLASIEEFCREDFPSRCTRPIEKRDHEQLCEVVWEALLERPDMVEVETSLLLGLLRGVDGLYRDTVAARYLMEGEVGNRRFLALWSAADGELREELRLALEVPTIRPWLPAELEALLEDR